MVQWRCLGVVSGYWPPHSQSPRHPSEKGFPCSPAGKELACNAGDPGLIPQLGRSPGEGIGYPLQYSWAWDQIANISWIIEKATEFQKKSTSALLTMPKPLTVWIKTNWKILKEMGIPDHLTCLSRNLYAGQEATVRTGHGTVDWFQIGKEDCQGCINKQFTLLI